MFAMPNNHMASIICIYIMSTQWHIKMCDNPINESTKTVRVTFNDAKPHRATLCLEKKSMPKMKNTKKE